MSISSPIARAKSHARQAARERLRLLDPAAMVAAAERIAARFAEREDALRRDAERLSDGPPVATLYLPLPGEVDVEPIARRWLADGWTVCFPRVDWATGTMEAAAVSSANAMDDELETSEHNVRMPGSRCRAVEIRRVGLVLTPALAFDTQGARLGRGGGFYDRFLARLPPGAKAIGVAFQAQLTDRLPTEPHDRRMDAVVTEHAWWDDRVEPAT